jgi:hypothetical protein
VIGTTGSLYAKNLADKAWILPRTSAVDLCRKVT